jgi:hypothetical protein
MRWKLFSEEYSPDLQYIKGTHNVVADALSCLEIKETPFEDTQETFLGLMECFAKKADADEFHPLNYQQLKNAQDKDKTIQMMHYPNEQGGSMQIRTANQQQIGQPKLGGKKCVRDTTINH